MYRGTRKLVPLFYNTILQKCKNAKERAQSTKLAWGLCRATQHFDYEISKCKGARAESSLLELGLSFLKTMLYYHKNNVNLCISGTLISIYNHVFVTYHIN